MRCEFNLLLVHEPAFSIVHNHSFHLPRLALTMRPLQRGAHGSAPARVLPTSLPRPCHIEPRPSCCPRLCSLSLSRPLPLLASAEPRAHHGRRDELLLLPAAAVSTAPGHLTPSHLAALASAGPRPPPCYSSAAAAWLPPAGPRGRSARRRLRCYGSPVWARAGRPGPSVPQSRPLWSSRPGWPAGVFPPLLSYDRRRRGGSR